MRHLYPQALQDIQLWALLKGHFQGCPTWSRRQGGSQLPRGHHGTQCPPEFPTPTTQKTCQRRRNFRSHLGGKLGPQTPIIAPFLSSSRTSSSCITPARRRTHFTDGNSELCGSDKPMRLCESLLWGRGALREALGLPGLPRFPTRGHPSLASKSPQCRDGESPFPPGSLPRLMDTKCGFPGSALPGFLTLPAASL